jgi:biopolymer transport protein ExbD
MTQTRDPQAQHHKEMQRKRRFGEHEDAHAASGAMSDINITPLIDVMLVLLIIFMVITPMLQKGVDVRLPQAGNTKERKDEPKTIVVAVKKDMTTYLGSAKLESQAELLPQVKERLQDLPEGARLIYLKADEGLPYSEVMKVMDLCREAGVEEVALISERKVQG